MRKITSIALLFALASCADGGLAPVNGIEIELSISPVRAFYRTGQTVQLSASVTSLLGAALPDEAIEFSAEPADRVDPMASDVQQASYRIVGDGAIDFTACVVGAVTPTCDTIHVEVDDGSPVLSVEAPEPGAEIDDPAGILVRGSVADSSGQLSVFVRGELVDVDAMGRFETTIPARFGVEHIDVVASDGLTVVSSEEMDVLWAPAFEPALSEDMQPAARVNDGLSFWLGQDVLDDGVPFDDAARPVAARDLADVLELAALHVDLHAVIPDPVVNNRPTLYLRLPTATLGTPEVEVSFVDDGFEIFMRLGHVHATTAGSLLVAGETIDLTGNLGASVAAYAHATVRKGSIDDEVEVELTDVEIALESIDGTFADPDATAVFRLVGSLLRTSLEAQMRSVVEGVLAGSVPGVIRGVLSGLDHALDGRWVTISRAPFPHVEIDVTARLDRVETQLRRHMLAPVSFSLHSAVPSVHPASRGYAYIGQPATSLDSLHGAAARVGLRTALPNALLHVLWNSGALDVDITETLSPEIAPFVGYARFAGRLPPILRPSRIGESHDLVLELGQLELEVAPGGRATRFGITISAGVDIELVANALRIDVEDAATVRVWAIDVAGNERVATPEAVQSALEDFWPRLRDLLEGWLSRDFSFGSLGGLSTIAPTVAPLTFWLDQTEYGIETQGETIFLDATLTGRLP